MNIGAVVQCVVVLCCGSYGFLFCLCLVSSKKCGGRRDRLNLYDMLKLWRYKQNDPGDLVE